MFGAVTADALLETVIMSMPEVNKGASFINVKECING